MECRRRKAKACQQIMAPLLLARLETSMRAFMKTEVDFAGPFVTVQGRGKRQKKTAIYACSPAWQPERFILSSPTDSTRIRT